MIKSNTQILIIDDDLSELNPVIIKLQQLFEEVKLFSSSKDGISYVRENISNKIILLLDVRLSKGEDGHKALSELRNISKLIPVIIWSALDEMKEPFFDFINNDAFAIFKKDAAISSIVEKVVDADHFLNNDIASALEQWILKNDTDKEKPYMLSSNGKMYTLNDILREIRLQTELGKTFASGMNKLTIELLMRNKENLK